MLLHSGYDPGARAIIEALQRCADVEDGVWADAALYAVLGVSPAVAFLPTLLRDEDVWTAGLRRQFLARMHGDPIGGPFEPRTGFPMGGILSAAATAADEESAPWITEWHLARVLTTGGGAVMMRQAGIRSDVFLEKARAASGQAILTDDDRRKTWCFADTNFFLHYRFFDEVDWHRELGFDHVVLVVPTVVIRELDHHKGNPDPRWEKRRDRARKVVRRLSEIAFAAPAGQPALVRSGVEFLLQGHEPRAFPNGLDPGVPDDRIIAAALEFRWRHIGSQVVILSGDLALQVKAHARGLARVDIPPSCRLS